MSEGNGNGEERRNYDGELVEVETGHDPDTAVLLLDAAEKAGMPVEWVQTTSAGFLVPKEVADAAGVDYGTGEDDQSAEDAEDGDDGGEVQFSSRSEARAYADEHNIQIDGGDQMSSADYKAAVAAAAKGE